MFASLIMANSFSAIKDLLQVYPIKKYLTMLGFKERKTQCGPHNSWELEDIVQNYCLIEFVSRTLSFCLIVSFTTTIFVIAELDNNGVNICNALRFEHEPCTYHFEPT